MHHWFKVYIIVFQLQQLLVSLSTFLSILGLLIFLVGTNLSVLPTSSINTHNIGRSKASSWNTDKLLQVSSVSVIKLYLIFIEN